MYEDQTYEEILDRTLDRVATDVDKREGSIIMNAIAPVSAEHANLYILLDDILQNGYADTAVGEYLERRCRERGIVPRSATHAVLKGKFNTEIPLESRFSLNEINYKAIEYIEAVDGMYYYQMQAETAGTEGNKYFGELTPIEYISPNFEGELVELLTSAKDVEDDESLRSRYFNSFNSMGFGGNIQDYRDKTDALDGIGGIGVGGTVVIPIWNGGGTVKLVIMDSNYNVASEELVAYVQEQIDPAPQGTGSGIAPIGHTVTVVPAVGVPINVVVSLDYDGDYTWSSISPKVTSAIEEYLLDLRKDWEGGSTVVRISQIESRLLNIEGVVDVLSTTLNGSTSNLALSKEELPVLGGVTNV